MSKLAWDQIGEKVYETGVDHGVLYLPDANGAYSTGVAWNGLTTITESPSGAESNPQYADNIKYINLTSAEEFGATVEAFTYPPEFAQCDGTAVFYSGITIGQQTRKPFGLSYRTLKGNDLKGTDFGFKLHLIYGATAAPSERAFATVNDSPEAITFSWELSTSAVSVSDVGGVSYKPTATLTIDSTKVDPTALAALMLILYGDTAIDPRLPLPNEVFTLFQSALTQVDLTGANAPSYVSGTHIVTLPTVAGVTWKINGVTKPAGAQPALTVGQRAVVTSVLGAGYVYAAGSDDDWVYTY